MKSERKFISQKYYQWSHCSKLSFLDLQKNYCSRLSSRNHLNEWEMRIRIYELTYESYLRNFCSTPSFPVLRWSCCSKLSYQTHRWSCCSISSCQDHRGSCCSRLSFLTNIHQLSQRTCCINNPKQCLCNSSSFKILSSAKRQGVRETWLELWKVLNEYLLITFLIPQKTDCSRLASLLCSPPPQEYPGINR